MADTRPVTVPPIPHGPVKHTWYAHGYQAAMIDIARELDEGGVKAVREWLENNTKRGGTRG